MSQKWTAAQHRKYKATCDAKRAAREAKGGRGKFPTHAGELNTRKAYGLLKFARQALDSANYEVVGAYLILAQQALEEP